MARVLLENVTKKFGSTKAVDNLSIEIQDKEFLVLVGPSGCGKSTTLRMIAGLEEITEGNIYIGDRLVNEVAPKDRDIAMVFQSYALYPHMSVFDNLAFGLRLRGTPKEELERRVKEAAAVLGIEELLNRKPKQLSGGQRQRVALGRAIVREPKVFLMDEPLSNLDAKLRVQTRAELIKLHQRLQTTVVYVTHDQVEAMTMGSRIAVMKDGLLQQLDTPQNLYDHPANAFVGAFIGSPAMNFFRARLDRSEGEVYLQAEGFRLQLPPDYTREIGIGAGREVSLGIRPEHIVEVMPGEASDSTIKASLEVAENLGSESILTLRIGNTNLVSRSPYRPNRRPGETLELAVDTSRIHLFDIEEGMTLRRAA
ncbi:MAG: ABC transporter ATP-binding protein [Chloroflexota bacterium]|jgi:multiple sugar transport system ATP-binding protein